jgi:hypothetical protein
MHFIAVKKKTKFHTYKKQVEEILYKLGIYRPTRILSFWKLDRMLTIIELNNKI